MEDGKSVTEGTGKPAQGCTTKFVATVNKRGLVPLEPPEELSASGSSARWVGERRIYPLTPLPNGQGLPMALPSSAQGSTSMSNE